MDMAFSPDGKTILTGCEDNVARLWDIATRTVLVPPLQHQGWAHSVAFSPDGKTVLTCGGSDRTARLWDAATGMPIGPALSHPSSVWGVAFSPDGKTILTGCGDGLTRFFSMAELPEDPERAAAWIEVLTGLALDARRGSIHILDNAAWRASRARLERLGGPPETVPPR
jgi:WD40 repeat protein